MTDRYYVIFYLYFNRILFIYFSKLQFFIINPITMKRPKYINNETLAGKNLKTKSYLYINGQCSKYISNEYTPSQTKNWLWTGFIIKKKTVINKLDRLINCACIKVSPLIFFNKYHQKTPKRANIKYFDILIFINCPIFSFKLFENELARQRLNKDPNNIPNGNAR